MKIRIPYHSSSASITGKRSRTIIEEILKFAHCRILKKVTAKNKPMKIEAEKLLRNGRIHIKVSCPGKYEIDIHFDSEEHLKSPRFVISARTLKWRRRARCHADCKEVRMFINKCVIPIILKHRKYFDLMVKSKWRCGCTELLKVE